MYERTYLRFSFLSCVLPDLSYEDYRNSSNIVARLNLPNMRYRPEQRIEVYAHAVRGLRALEPELDQVSKYLDFIDIYTALDEEERKIYIGSYPEEASFMSTFAERFRQQGMQQGEALLLLRLLSRKFGEVPEDKRRMIESADSERLLQWSERILNAESLDDVLQ